MATLAENIERNNLAWDKSREALIAKGQQVPDNTPVEAYADKIRAISGGEPTPEEPLWERPADRPVKPEMSDNTLLMLFGVGKESPNDYSVVCETSTGQYRVDWGDGTADLYYSGVKADHIYDFDAIDKPVDSQGYKMCWITITPVSGDITHIDFLNRHSLRPPASASNVFVPQVFEMYIQCPNLTSLSFSTPSSPSVRHALLEIFSLDTNNITGSLDCLLKQCYNLRIIEKLAIEKANTLSEFMGSCHSYNQPFPESVTFSNATINFMQSCYSYNQPFPEGVTFANIITSFMQNCYSYNQPFPKGVTFANITTNFMNGCYSYNQPFPKDVTFANITTSFMFYNHSYNQPFPEGVTFSNATTSFMQNCYSYNQPFPEGATFSNATINFMQNCYSYNQPFPEGATFSNATTNFMQNCYSYNYTLTVDLSRTADATTATYIGPACYALKGLRIKNMSLTHSVLTISNSSLDVDALTALFNDLCDRTSTTAGTITITGCYGADKLTAGQRTIATNKNWTIVG